MNEKKTDQALNKKAFKAGIVYIVAQLFVRGVTFLMTPIYTRLLSQAQYNQIRIYESWLQIFMPVMSLCLWRSVERAKYDVKERFNEFVSSVQTLSYLSITVFFLLFLICKDAVFRISAVFSLTMTDFMLYVAFLYTYAHCSIFYYQRREKQMMRYKASTLFTALTVVPATVLSVALIWAGRERGREDSLVSLRIGGYYIPMIIGGFIACLILIVQGKRLVNLAYWKYALRFSLPLIPEVLSIQIMNQADKLMVTSMTGEINGSVFALATTVSYIIWILEDSVWNAWLPWMYEKISRDESSDIGNYWSVLMHAFGAVSWLLVLFAPEIVLILGSKKYEAAIYLIAPTVTGTLFRFYSCSYTAIQNYHKKTGFVAVSTVSVMFLNVILNYLFILLLGYRAAAYTTAFSYLVLMCMQAFMEKRLTGCQVIPLRRTLRISCGYFLMSIATMSLFGTPFAARLALAVCLTALAAKLYLPRLQTVWGVIRNHKKQ